MNKICKVVFFTVAFVFTLLFSGCSDLLNDKWEDSADKLADAMGTDFNQETYSDSVSGSVSRGGGYVIYRFYAYAGTDYKVSCSGNDVQFYYGYSSTDVSNYLSSYSDNTISPSSDQYVYIKVSTYYNYSHSFSLTVSCINKRISLFKWEEKTENTYTISDTISNSDGYIIYKFYGYGNSVYNISWTNIDDANMSVEAGDYSNYESYFNPTTTSGQDIEMGEYGSDVYIKVMPSDTTSVGTFSLTVTESSGSNGVSLSVYEKYNVVDNSSIELTVGDSWTTGEITSDTSYVIYKFYASSYNNYYVYWDDSYEGSGSTTVDVKVYYNVGSDDFSDSSGADSGYNTPLTIYPGSSGYVYLKVEPYSSGNTGTFKIHVTTY